MEGLLTRTQKDLRARAQTVSRECIAPRSAEVDQNCLWPEHAMRALAEAGLLGMHVPSRLGGLEQGLLSLVITTEAVANACSSAALVFGMHCVASAVIAAKATAAHEDKYLGPIAEGKHVTALALSEAGTGSFFFLPQTTLQSSNGHFVLNGTKQFVTSGGQADSYVVSTVSTESGNVGEFSCVIVDRDTPGIHWLEPWRGLGMRGNSSRGMRLSDVHVPKHNLLGNEGDQIWYAFEVIAPYFLMAMSATFLGITQAALNITFEHMRDRRYTQNGERLADVPILQHRVAELWAEAEKTRYLVYHAAQLGDLGVQEALPAILASKAEAATTAVHVVNEASTICGGQAYRQNSDLSRLLRDARAGHVMAPTTDILKQWAGRALLGLPLL